MNKKILDSVIKSLYVQGYFSEYLPDEFISTDFTNLKTLSLQSTDTKPYTYTMNKNEASLERRTISIPEIGSYINAVKYFESSGVLKYILSLSNDSKYSLSKVFTKNGKVRSFSNPYRDHDTEVDKIDDEDFIGNTITKLRKAMGSTGILKLDIANFYGSFYTHNIACIGKGSEWAEEQYRLNEDNKADKNYKILKKLDGLVGKLNQKRTHGLLIGPLMSFIIAEGLMSTIDDEVIQLLRETIGKDIEFVRFIDDYDVFIKSEEDIPLIILTFTRVLEKYGFVLGDNKTEYIKFPFYIYEDFKGIVKYDEDSLSSKGLLNIYSKLANLELTEKQKGGLFFFASNLEHLLSKENYEDAMSLLLSIIKENAKSIPVACKTIIKICNEYKANIDGDAVFNDLYDYLLNCIDKQYEWEQIWLIYTLIKLDSDKLSTILSKIIKEKLSELAIILLLNEFSLNKIEKDLITKNAEKSSWLLKYELYRLNIIDEEFLKTFLIDDKTISNFNILKNNNCQLYKSTKKESDELPF